MKRRIFKLCLLLLLGAIINVAVAWGCVLAAKRFRTTNYQIYEIERNHDWMVSIESSPGAERVTSATAWINPIESFRSPETPRPKEPIPVLPEWTGLPRDPPEGIDRLDASGWPAMALYARFEQVATQQLRFRTSAALGGFVVKNSSGVAARYPFFDDNITLPLRPIWPGFAINTIFYAAILWPLCAAPGFVRRRIRARRGQCPACAYPIGTSNVCTECGLARDGVR